MVAMRVAIVAEYYPRAADPVLGIWAHRQALAARDAGADVRRARAAPPGSPARRAARARPRARSPRPCASRCRRARRDRGHLRPVPRAPAPPLYATWGRWAARRWRSRCAPAAPFPFDLVHAHYAAPGRRRGAARARRARRSSSRSTAATCSRRPALAGRRAPSRGALARAAAGARQLRRDGAPRPALGADRDARRAPRHRHPGRGHPRERAPRSSPSPSLIARKRHGDVLRALWLLRDSHPALEWVVVGDGPERGALERLAQELGLGDRVELHRRAARTSRRSPRRAAARVRAAERRRGVRRRLRRGDGRRRAGDRLPRRGRARGDRGGRRAASGSCRPASPRRCRRARACSTRPPARRAGRRRPRDGGGRSFTLGGVRPGDRRGLRDGARAAERSVGSRCRLDARPGGAAASARSASPSSQDAPRARARSTPARPHAAVELARLARACIVEFHHAQRSHGGTRNRLMELPAARACRFLPRTRFRGPRWPGGAARRLRADEASPVCAPYLPRPMRARWCAASCGVLRALRRAPAGRPRRRAPARPSSSRSANGAVARWAWDACLPPAAYAEDQQLARDVLAAPTAFVRPPRRSHSHEHRRCRPSDALRRLPRLAEVHGLREPLSRATSPPASAATRGRSRVHAPRRAPGADAALARAIARRRSAPGAGRPGPAPDRGSLAALNRRRPVLFVTNHAPPFRVGAFAALHEREDVVFALIGGDVRHGGGGDRRRDAPVPGVRPSQRGVPGSPPPAASARWSPASPAASRCPPRTPGARRRACRSCCGRRSGRTRARRRTRSPTSRCATSTATRTRSPPTARTFAPTSGPRARSGRSSRRRRASTTRSGRRPRSPSAARRSRSCSPADWRGRRASTCSRAWQAVASSRAGSGRRRSDPSPGRRHRRGVPRAGPGAAQLLRGQRRCGRTVDPHARLPRAVGARRQRSLPPGSSRDRHRRRRRRRRRPGRSTSAPASSSPPATPARSPPRCAACTTTRRCARASAPPRARPSRAYTHAAWADGMARALAAAGADAQEAAASVNPPMLRLAILPGPARGSRWPLPRPAPADADPDPPRLRRTTACCRATTRLRAAQGAQRTSRPTSTSTPTAATCSRARAAQPSRRDGGERRRRQRRLRRRPGGGGGGGGSGGAPAAGTPLDGDADRQSALDAGRHGRRPSRRDRGPHGRARRRGSRRDRATSCRRRCSPSLILIAVARRPRRRRSPAAGAVLGRRLILAPCPPCADRGRPHAAAARRTSHDPGPVAARASAGLMRRGVAIAIVAARVRRPRRAAPGAHHRRPDRR